MAKIKTIKTIYKKTEFKEFIKTLEEGSIEHWVEIARALGVDQNTITSWKELPEAQEARRKGIRRALEEMEKVGRRDWKMWKDKLALLDVQSIDKKDVTSAGEKLDFNIEIIESKKADE